MRRLLPPLLILTVLALVPLGCDSFEADSLSPRADVPRTQATSSITLSGYTIEFLRAEAAPGGLRFSYRVTGDVSPVLNWFFLETCGLDVSVSSPDGAEAFALGEASGLRWNQALGVPQTRDYSVTVPLGTAIGDTRVALRRGSSVSSGVLPGPCGASTPTLATLSGSVYVSVDGDGTRDPSSEVGIPSVLVEVRSGAAVVASAATDAEGAFSFSLPISTTPYTVTVPRTAAGLFNAQLYTSYNHVGGGTAEASVVLAGDRAVDFGFSPNIAQLIEDLTTGAFQTQARKVNYWRNQVRFALLGVGCEPPAEICRDDLGDYLDAIFSTDAPNDTYYLLPDPFVLPPGADKFQHAYQILFGVPQTPEGRVEQNLFAMQLNLMKGWGTGNDAFETALQGYLEGWVLQRRALGAAASQRVGGGGGGVIEEDLTRVYLGGGGGGVVEL